MTIDDRSAERDANACLWGVQLGLDNAIFRQVAIGKEFRFVSSDEWLVKVDARRYVDQRGRKFTTGRRTAVWVSPSAA